MNRLREDAIRVKQHMGQKDQDEYYTLLIWTHGPWLSGGPPSSPSPILLPNIDSYSALHFSTFDRIDFLIGVVRLQH